MKRSSKSKSSLGRRRGTASSRRNNNSPFRRTMLIMALIAIALTSGLVSLFFLMGPSGQERAHKVQSMLRHGTHPLAVAPGESSSRMGGTTTTDSSGETQVPSTAKKPHQFAEPHHLKAGAAAAASDTGKVDLKPYDDTPTQIYPYSLKAVEADYDISVDFTVQGGSRFSEYTTGGTPYLITQHVKDQSDAQARSRRSHVKAAMKHAWDGYEKYAFGSDELKPVSGKGNNNWGGQGITLVDALDTLWLMDMKDEFYKGRDWVRDHLAHDQVGAVSVFETTIRDLGGLLAAYDWSGDDVFLEKAKDLGSRLLHAFDGSPTGIPFGSVNLQTGKTSSIGWSGGNSIIAEFGTIQIENRYLTKMTGDMEYAEKTEHVFDVLQEISPDNGLFPYFVRNKPRGGGTKPEFANSKLTFGAMADSLYEYMLKIWIQGGKRENQYRRMYDKAMDGMHAELLQTSTPSGLTYIADKNGSTMDHKMDHLVCFMGGLLALGAYTDPMGLESDRAQRDLRSAKALTYTCYQMYARMGTGISAEYVQFYPGRDFEIGRGAPHYLLRPEAFESFFILNQLTGDPVYREWGWEAFQSIEKYCKTQYAYGALSNVQNTEGRPRDSMESFFLAETLKYLYLLQDPDTEIDILNKHVFNTEAHPMRIFPLIDK